jgi:2-amino-4-hydroxy-6-hydroxymethyldihydropteridine diphosphokinase
MTESRVTYLSAGSNLGDRIANLRGAIDGLRRAGILVRQLSPVYETEPVGLVGQPWFLNIAVEAETRLSPQQLLVSCQDIESVHGRTRSFPGAPRTLDLDILLIDDLVVESPSLQVPHPRMTERRFVLEPLAWIAPAILHPVLNQTILTLLARCPDPSRVTLYSEPGR